MLAEVQRLATAWLDGRAAVFEDRIAGGHAVDGHGDVLAEDIFCLDDGPRILDCIEFDDHLRHVDVWNDVAFLVMDLERLGRADLGELLRDTYREMSADTAPPALIDVFVAYRALVRAKVAALRSRQNDPGPGQRLLRRRGPGPSRPVPRPSAPGPGPAGRRRRAPGTGKSTVAAGLAEALDASVLSSDPLRKELVGMAADDSAASDYRTGAYADDVTGATYRTLLERAAVVLARGGSVILDASWTDRPTATTLAPLPRRSAPS